MKKIFLILITTVVMTACNKKLEDYPEPYGIDTITPPDTDTYISPLANTTWFIQEYRIGPFGNNIPLNDELKFESNNVYYYNGYTTRYSLTQTIDGYMLTLYETRWGHISGFIYNYNLSSGEIDGIQFKNIMSNSSQPIFIWMKRQ